MYLKLLSYRRGDVVTGPFVSFASSSSADSSKAATLRELIARTAANAARLKELQLPPAKCCDTTACQLPTASCFLPAASRQPASYLLSCPSSPPPPFFKQVVADVDVW